MLSKLIGNFPCFLSGRRFRRHDQQVQVTSLMRLAVCIGAEEDDLLGTELLYDLSDHL